MADARRWSDYFLDGHQLQKECQAFPAHLRKAGSFALEGVCVHNARARVGAVVGLFQAWLFIAGAQRLGVEAAWQELLSQACEVNTAEDESQADELWRQRREREPKRLKVEPQQFAGVVDLF